MSGFTNHQEFDDDGKLIDEEFDSVTELLSDLTLMMGRNLYFWDAESVAHAESERCKAEGMSLLGGIHLLKKGVSIDDFMGALRPVAGVIMYWAESDENWETECVDV